jgi:hypothetical protein
LFCLNTGQFVLDFQRQVSAAAPVSSSVSISSGGPTPLYFAYPPTKPAGFEIWGLRMTKASIQSLANLPQIDSTEAGQAADVRRVARSEKLSTEGLSSMLANLIETCPPQKDMVPLQTSKPLDSNLLDSASK